MDYTVTARKWRPLRFDEVIGQNHITRTLKNAVRMQRIYHAYLFSGPRGIGKTTTARILARALNCKSLDDGEPCNKCDSCLAILDGRSLDVVEIDGASNNSVDDIRTLRENVKYPPVSGKYKIYIIDEVHMLSTSAFNALLKTLEEPPQHLVFIFATTESHKVIPTIVSRCQRFDFHRLEIKEIVEHISRIAKAEGIQIDEMSLYTIAKKADGSMRDAQSIFDQFVTSAGNKIKYDLVKEILHFIDLDYYFMVSDAYLNREVSKAFEICNEITNKGYDYNEFISGLLEHFRNIFVSQMTDLEDFLKTPDVLRKKYKDTADKFSIKDTIRIMNLISQTEQQIKFASMPKIRLELLLAQIIDMPSVKEIDELIKEIKSLKELNFQSETVSYSNKNLTENKLKEKSAVIASVKKVGNEKVAENKKWEEFLEKYKNLNGLKSFIESQLLEVEFKDRQILLVALSEITFETINSRKNKIKAAIKEFFGKDYDLEVIFKDARSSKSLKEENINVGKEFNSVSSNFSPKKGNLSEAEKIIIELFGGKEYPLPQK
ncbi:MAG: DNA polymerase III subunit gamma/tau [Ignavibacteria bacterium]|nr:DNA polymerase III subunit gamma/tau [Ignavibacteria bacterium]